jgi:hypothetical protein
MKRESDKSNQNKSWDEREILLCDSFPVQVRARLYYGKFWRKSRLAASRIKDLSDLKELDFFFLLNLSLLWWL